MSSNMFFLGPVEFTATITNNNRCDVQISAYGGANIDPEYLKDPNGNSLADFVLATEFERDPQSLTGASFFTLQGGGASKRFLVDGIEQMLPPGGLSSAIRTFHPTVAGTYRVKFRYQYLGPDNGNPGILHAPIESPEVTFHLE